MADVETVKIETDDRGFELHLVVGDDIVHRDDGLVILNIHGVALELLKECERVIGPYRDEMESARAEYRAGVRAGGLTDAEREEEIRCAAHGLEGPNAKQYRWERAQ